MGSQLEIRSAGPEDAERRDAFVEAHPQGTFFHLAGWGRVVQRVFWHPIRDLLAFRGDELVGVLPLTRSPGLVGPGNLISSSYAVYGGPIALDEESRQALIDAAVEEAEAEGVGCLELRYRDDTAGDLERADLYYTFVRELPTEVDDVLKRMPKKSRAEARKARKRHGLELTTGVWYVDDLYRMFAMNKHGLGSPALPPAMFHELAREFPKRVTVHLVQREREPLAAVMTFRFGETLNAYYSGTQPGADRTYSASNFMYMALQEWAVNEGFREFDFGRSRRGAGAFKFKVHQGFEPAPLHYRYRLVSSRSVPSFNPSNPKTHMLQSVWRKLPSWAVRPLSDRLSRYLP